MSSFDTPEPISVSVELGVGDIRIAASDRRDTVVEVRPSHPTKRSDVTAAEQTVVEYAGGTLVIRAPRRWTRYAPWGGSESIDVRIALPSGSNLRVDAGLAAIRGAGSLGDCHIKTGAGEIRLDAAGSLQLRTGTGDVTLERAVGQVGVSTGTGSVRMGAIDGAAAIKNSTGDTWIGEVTGDLQVRAAFGRISVDRAHARVTAKTAYGDVRLGEVARGAILAQTAYGRIEVGVRSGVAAWLDLQARHGNVLNDLEAAGPPGPGEDAVEVHAQSSFGDIAVRRSSPSAPQPVKP